MAVDEHLRVGSLVRRVNPHGTFTLYWGDGDYTAADLDIAKDGTLTFHDIQDSNPALQAESEGMFGSPRTRVADITR